MNQAKKHIQQFSSDQLSLVFQCLFIWRNQKNEFPSSRGKNIKAEEDKGILVLIKHILKAAGS